MQLQRRVSVKAVVLGAIVLALPPALAQAGPTVTGGGQSLSVSTSVTPNNAGAQGVTLKLHAAYQSTVPNQRITAQTREIRFDLPEGMTVNLTNAGVCDAVKATGKAGVKACPANSIVGTGTVTADARPALPNPVSGTLTIYNARGKHNDLLLSVHTSLGDLLYIFYILDNDTENDNDRDVRFDAQFVSSSSQSLYTLQTLDFSIHNSSTGKPYLNNPGYCPGGKWLVGLYVANYGGLPNLYAPDAASCAHANARYAAKAAH